MRRSLLGALLLVAALAACGSAAPKDNGEAAKKGPEVLADAKAALRTAGTFRVSGSVMQQGQSLVVDLLVKAGQGSRGTVTVAGQKVDLVTTGGIGYLRAPAGFYTAQGAPAATAQLAGGKYVKIPAGQAKELDAFSNIDTLLATSGAVQPAVAPADVGGAKAVVVSDAQGRLLVAATGPALPLRLESTKGSGVATFSQFGTPVDLTPPPGSIDAAALTGGK